MKISNYDVTKDLKKEESNSEILTIKNNIAKNETTTSKITKIN